MTDRAERLFLLVRTGVILGLMLATVNWAAHSGWGGLAFTLAPVFATGMALGLLVALFEMRRWSWSFWRYSAVSGALGLVLPNWLVFLTMAQDGVITAAVFYLLSPLFTQALTWLLGYDRILMVRLLGLCVGTLGAAVLVLGAGGAADGVPLLGLAIPLSLALGNIYRKYRMPKDKSPLTLAAGMLLASGLLFLPILLMALGLGWAGVEVGSFWPLAVQTLIMGLGFVSYFQFLRRVDPVYFSQLGYLITVTGSVAGVLLFGETPGWHHGVSLALVAGGVWLVARQERRPGATRFT